MISEDTLAIAASDSVAKRRLVLEALIDHNRLAIRTASDKVKLQFVALRFPDELQPYTVSLPPPHFPFGLSSLSNAVGNKWFKPYPKAFEASAATATLRTVPVAVTSQYVAEGEAFGETSVYLLVYDLQIGDDGLARVRFRDLVFNYRMNDERDPVAEVNRIWKKQDW